MRSAAEFGIVCRLTKLRKEKISMKNLRWLVLVGVLVSATVAGLAFARSGKQDVQATQEVAENERIEGSWYVSVQVTEPSPATFDALYGFADGGVFTRIDGRNNAPALGSWRRGDDGQIVFSARLFNFVNGVRVGYIDGQFSARVVDGTLTGTFTAEGNGIPGFLPRSGSFTATRIVPEHP
jgi:hypothetical protein